MVLRITITKTNNNITLHTSLTSNEAASLGPVMPRMSRTLDICMYSTTVMNEQKMKKRYDYETKMI